MCGFCERILLLITISRLVVLSPMSLAQNLISCSFEDAWRLDAGCGRGGLAGGVFGGDLPLNINPKTGILFIHGKDILVCLISYV